MENKNKSDRETYVKILKKNVPSSSQWADTMEKEEENIKEHKKHPDAIAMFSITSNEAPFLVGVKGRNISLIRKFTGMLITVDNYVIYMTPSRKNYDIELAWKMVLSACFGGILRWFENPYATKKGYPSERVDEFSKLADSLEFTLNLLRSRKGHMCLMLTPAFKVPGQNINDCPTAEDLNYFKDKIQNARGLILNALNAK